MKITRCHIDELVCFTAICIIWHYSSIPWGYVVILLAIWLVATSAAGTENTKE